MFEKNITNRLILYVLFTHVYQYFIFDNCLNISLFDIVFNLFKKKIKYLNWNEIDAKYNKYSLIKIIINK